MAEPITGGFKRWRTAGGEAEQNQRTKDRAAKKASRKQERTAEKQAGKTNPPP